MARGPLGVNELQIGAQRSERFGTLTAWVGVHDEGALLCLGVEHNAAENRKRRDFFKVFLIVDACIQCLTQHSKTQAHSKANQNSQNNVERNVGTHWFGGHRRCLNRGELNGRGLGVIRRLFEPFHGVAQTLCSGVGYARSQVRINILHRDIDD